MDKELIKIRKKGLVVSKDFLKKIEDCNQCNFLNSKDNKVLPRGNVNSKYIFIVKEPTNLNLKEKQFFSKESRSGRYLGLYLKAMDILEEECYFTSLSFCKNAIGTCKYYMLDIFCLCESKVVFLCGHEVVREVLNRSKSERYFYYEKSFVTKSFFNSNLCYVYCLVHPVGYEKFIKNTGVDYLGYLSKISKEFIVSV